MLKFNIFKNTVVDKPTIIPINVARITHLRTLINNTVSSLKTFFIIRNYTYSLQTLLHITVCVFAKCQRHLRERSEPQTRCYMKWRLSFFHQLIELLFECARFYDLFDKSN